MKVSGRRKDGTLNLSIGAGMAVLMRSGRKSSPIDIVAAAKLGPWFPADSSLATRRALEHQLRLARVVPLRAFALDMSFDERRERVMTGLRVRLGLPAGGNGPMPAGSDDAYIPQNGLGDDWVVYCRGGKHFGMGYAVDGDGAVQFEGEPEEVRPGWEAIEADVEAHHDFGAYVENDSKYMECKQTAWFKKFMASKRKALTAMPVSPEVPESLPAPESETLPDLN